MALLVKLLPHFILVSRVANENSYVNLILIYMQPLKILFPLGELGELCLYP